MFSVMYGFAWKLDILYSLYDRTLQLATFSIPVYPLMVFSMPAIFSSISPLLLRMISCSEAFRLMLRETISCL